MWSSDKIITLKLLANQGWLCYNSTRIFITFKLKIKNKNMPSIEIKKIKITFLVFFFILIFGYSVSIFATENSSDENIASDVDQDGLSDSDEINKYGTDPKNSDSDRDGYSDGAEVKSGYNPLKPAPGDKMEEEDAFKEESDEITNKISLESSDDSSGNMTQDLSNQIAALMSSEEIGEGGISMDKINDLIEGAIAKEITFDDLPTIDQSSIKILKQDYSGFSEEKQARKIKEDSETYLSAVFYIMANNSPRSIASEEEIKSFSDEIIAKIPYVTSTENGVDYFNDLADRGEKTLEELNKLEVPENMLEIHIKGLQLATYGVSLRNKVSINNSDPIASIVSLSQVEKFLALVTDFSTEVEQKLEGLGLSDFVIDNI